MQSTDIFVWYTYPHCHIISPWQEHDARIVLLNMGQVKIQKNIPNYEMHFPRRQIDTAKQCEHINWYQNGRI